MDYTDDTTDEPIHIMPENIMGVIIDYNFDSESVQPMTMVKVELDKNLIDQMVGHKSDGRIQLMINKIDVSSEPGVETPYINAKCTYELADDKMSDKSTLYGSDLGMEDPQDRYAQTTIGLVSEDIVNWNVISNDLVIRETNMMGAVCYFTKHIPIVIQPFDHNKEIDQLVIQPVESIKELLRFLCDVGTFYNTQVRFFYDFDCAYLTDSSGRGTPRDDEKYNTVILKAVNPDTDTGAFEQGIYELEEEQCYKMNFQTEDNQYKEDNYQDKLFNNIIGVVDPSREGSNVSLVDDIMSQAISAIDSITQTVHDMCHDICDGINNAIEGKHKINHETMRTSGESDNYKSNAKSAKGVCNSAIDQFGLEQYSPGLKEKVNTFDLVPSEVDNYMKTTKSGRDAFSEMSNTSTEAGYNVTTTFDTNIQGIKPGNIKDNVAPMKKQVPPNEKNNAKVDKLSNSANKDITKSMAEMNTSTSRSIRNIDDTLKALDQVPIAEKPGDPGFPAEQIAQAKAKLEEEKQKITENKSNMNSSYSTMTNHTKKGVDYGSDLVSTQSQETPQINILDGLQGKLNEVSSKFENVMTSLDEVTREGANNIKGAMQSMSAFADLGIGSLADLANIAGIADLTSIGKLGITAITDVKLDIPGSGEPKRSRYMGTTNDDPNKVKTIQHSVSLNARTITITKDNVDNSIFTINKEYLVKQSESKDDKGGLHLIKRKQEIYVREGDIFYSNIILDFCKCPEMNFDE